MMRRLLVQRALQTAPKAKAAVARIRESIELESKVHLRSVAVHAVAKNF